MCLAGTGPSASRLVPRPTRHLSDGGEELGLFLQAVESLFDGECEHLLDQLVVVIVMRHKLDLQVVACAADELLQTSKARLLASTLDPSDLRLRESRALGELALGETGSCPRFSNQCPHDAQ